MKISQKENLQGALPFVVEFVKFSTGFAAIVAVALITLRIAGTALP